MISDKHIFYLLKIVKGSKPLDSLVKIGFQYVQIVQLVDSAVEKGFLALEETNSEIILTKEGENELKRLSEKINYNVKSALVIEDDSVKIKTIDKNSVYIPNIENLEL